MALLPPPSFKDNVATDPKFRPCSLSDETEEMLVDINVTVVLLVTIFISSVVNKLLLEAEGSESLISKVYKKR